MDAGQYVNLWIPSVSFWSFLQSHPFVVTSWSDGRQDNLDFFIEPRRGLIRELLSHAGAADSRLVLFSGPYGISVLVGEYENVLMIASAFGVAAHLPYLKRLIHGYNARKVHARRIHLVWQLSDIGESRTDRSSAYTADEDRNWNCSPAVPQQRFRRGQTG
jgi:NAD(P)H-flavin reductase